MCIYSLTRPVRSHRLKLSTWLHGFFALLASWHLLAAVGNNLHAAALKPYEQAHVDIYKKLAASVVGINCKFPASGTRPAGSMFGTGTVISSDGLVLTDTTVVPKDAEEIKVYFIDGNVRTGVLKQSDESSESALIKVEASGLTFMTLADSNECKVGDPVYSWGNPYFTIKNDGAVSLSTGAISGIYNVCSVDNQSRYMGRILETDAAVNPGSDGGPLTDASGNLIGIMSLAFSRTRWLGLAIPSRRVIDALPELKSLHLVKRMALNGPAVQAWAFQSALQLVSENAAKATVGVRVTREDEKEEPAANRRLEELKPQEIVPSEPANIRALKEARRPTQGVSSGFIIDPKGLVITSAFNLDVSSAINETPVPLINRTNGKLKANQKYLEKHKRQKIYVYLPDGIRVEASLLAEDKYFDLAVLQLKGKAGTVYPYVQLETDANLLQGSSVAVLGRSESPGDVTLNVGRVSATKRIKDTCCQISALINYGNQGGPVIDLQGRIIGMASHLAEQTPWRQNCGVGFMLQSSVIQKILPDLMAGKKVAQPKFASLGVQGDMGALDVNGARIIRVTPLGPAANAGLKEGDIIIEFDGVVIEDWLGLLRILHEQEPGQTVSLKIVRKNEKLEINIELGAL